jgi:hypothetical protein
VGEETVTHLVSKRTGIAAGALILLASLIPLSQPYRHEGAWRVSPEHLTNVNRALIGGAAAFGLSPEEYRRITRPRVDRDQRRTCVTLATHRSDGGGSYRGCYDSRTGAVISEVARGVPFGDEGLWNRFGQWLW